MYKSFQCELLNNELKSRQREERRFKTEVKSTKNELLGVVSWIDFLCLSSYVSREVGKLRTKTSAIHNRKTWGHERILLRLTHQELSWTCPIVCSQIEKSFCCHLVCSFPVHKLSFYKYFLSIERFLKILGRCNIKEGFDFNLIKRNICSKALNTFHSFKLGKVKKKKKKRFKKMIFFKRWFKDFERPRKRWENYNVSSR